MEKDRTFKKKHNIENPFYTVLIFDYTCYKPHMTKIQFDMKNDIVRNVFLFISSLFQKDYFLIFVFTEYHNILLL